MHKFTIASAQSSSVKGDISENILIHQIMKANINERSF